MNCENPFVDLIAYDDSHSSVFFALVRSFAINPAYLLRDARARRSTDTGATRRLRRRARGRDLGRRRHHHDSYPSFVGFWRPRARSTFHRYRSCIDGCDDIHRSIRSIRSDIDRGFFFFPSLFVFFEWMDGCVDGWMDRIYLDVVVWVSSVWLDPAHTTREKWIVVGGVRVWDAEGK